MTTECSENTGSAVTAARGIPVRVEAAPVPGGPLALGFAITVAVWTVAYVCRMPMVQAPAALTVTAMLLTVVAGGCVAGRSLPRPFVGSALAGALSGLLDILMIGALFSEIRQSHPDFATPAAVAMWVGGSIALNAALAALGAALARAVSPSRPASLAPPFNAKAVLAWTLPVATLPLITAGGLVTAWGAGLAVPDWPSSFGYNMFLLPLSQMQGGTFYEHAHRLMGTLVGLTSLTLALYLTFHDRRGWVKTFAWILFVCVCLQGLLGGLRVTGRLTSDIDAAAMRPSTALAIVHGVFAQLVFALMAGLACACSRIWQSNAQPLRTPAAQTDYVFTAALVLLMVVQLVLGALLRHLNLFVILHITNSVFVTLLALASGVRAWGIYEGARPIQRAGLVVVVIVFAQLTLGLFALILRHPLAVHPTASHAIFTTLHQANGALLMAACIVLLFWTFRLARFPAPPDAVLPDSP